MPRRPTLTTDLVIEAAVRVADAGGLAQVSMRNVGTELGVEAMSLYHHVANKEALVDELANWVFAQIELPTPGAKWRTALAARQASARATIAAHPWALGIMESRRNPGEALLLHHEAVLACLRTNGFSVTLAAHAYSVLDAYVYGFVLTELNLPFADGESAEDFVDEIGHLLPVDQFPHMNEFIHEQVRGRDYSLGTEFDYGLELILDGLERRLRAERRDR